MATLIRSNVRSFLQQHQADLRQAPILVVSSKASHTDVKQVQQLIEKFHFHAQQEFGLRIVQSEIQSAFPTLNDVETAQKLVQRTGVGSIIGIGSGAAIDLAKSLSASSTCTLIPGTSASLLASHTTHSLLLDPNEETLIASKNSNERYSVLLDSESVVHSHQLAEWGCQAVLEDAKYRGFSVKTDSDNIESLLIDTAQYIHFGDNISDHHPRSAPVALAQSLIPQVFASTNILEFWASLLAAQQEINGEEQPSLDDDYPKLASLALEMQTVKDMWKHISSNQALTQSWDLPKDILLKILESSLNR